MMKETPMLTRLLAYLLGPHWQTSLIGLLAAVAYGAQAVPSLLDGTATAHDYMRAAVAALLYAGGRAQADGKTLPFPPAPPPAGTTQKENTP
jgi:hypothetical protein